MLINSQTSCSQSLWPPEYLAQKRTDLPFSFFIFMQGCKGRLTLHPHLLRTSRDKLLWAAQKDQTSFTAEACLSLAHVYLLPLFLLSCAALVQSRMELRTPCNAGPAEKWHPAHRDAKDLSLQFWISRTNKPAYIWGSVFQGR